WTPPTGSALCRSGGPRRLTLPGTCTKPRSTPSSTSGTVARSTASTRSTRYSIPELTRSPPPDREGRAARPGPFAVFLGVGTLLETQFSVSGRYVRGGFQQVRALHMSPDCESCTETFRTPHDNR